MPLPTPKGDESEQDFVSRFMGDDQAISDFPDEKQRAAVAYKQYRDEEMEDLQLPSVSILEEGEAKGHDLFVDRKSLEKALNIMREARNGVKVKMNHGSGLDAVVGFARNPRIDGNKLVADLRLLRNSPHYGLIREMASEAPDQFGVSLAFVNESETINGRNYIRPQSIASADLVSNPAATNGLFEEVLAFMEKVKFRCWEGYKPAKGVRPYAPGSCVKVETETQNSGETIKMGYMVDGKSIPSDGKDLTPTEKNNMENKADYGKDIEDIKVRLSALEESMKPKDEEKKEEKMAEAPKIEVEVEPKEKEDETEEMSEVVKKVLTEFGIKPVPASPVIEEAPSKKEEPKNFEALVAAHADYGTSKLKAMRAVMLSNPKEYAEALSRGISKL
jgi:hypothetical protein